MGITTGITTPSTYLELQVILIGRSKVMPVVYKCRNCGTILHVFYKVGQDYYGIPTPSEVISLFGGVCPRCGSKLRIPQLQDIRIVHLASAIRLRLAEIMSKMRKEVEVPEPMAHQAVSSTPQTVTA